MAIGEVVRVLRPGGQAVIADIRHLTEYRVVFVAAGCWAELLGSAFVSAVTAVVTFGNLRPNTLRARKSGL